MLDQIAHLVAQMPDHWATAPIYKKGVNLPSGAPAVGKSPLGKAHHQNLTPSESFLYLQEEPGTYGAIGVFSGARSRGLVILDVDANLGALEMKWGADLAKAPRINSPKQNAAKFLFRIAEEHWGSVSDVSLAASKQGFEVLWGRQGLVCGDYHAGGSYEVVGDLSAVPEAPTWLLAVMRKSFSEKAEKAEGNRLVDSRYSMRSREERIEIARSCLSVIPAPGRGSEDLWWRLGAMIASELPGDDGLELWRDWSKKDPEYAEDWDKDKDPCAARWEAGFNKKGLGFGSLVKLADHHDPTRARFQRDDLARLVEEVEAATVSYRQDYLSAEDLISKALELEETIEDPAYLDQAKTILAAQGGRAREGALAVDRLIDAHLTFKRNKGGKPSDVSQLDDTGFEYLIPGILPKPWLLLIHADAGTGKSATAMTICKHISQGKPFNIHGAMVDVPAGRCLWLNGDQSERITKRQFNLLGVERGVDVVGEWDMQWYRRFCRMQEERRYDLVVIDSLDGCNDSNPYEENRREYALPLKRLARRNGVDFPACSIIVIHHNNRSGGFRGTSAIKGAVDETWNMRKLEAKDLAEMGLPYNSRIITVEKSRDDREGQQMVFSLLPDYTYRIEPMPESKTRIKGNGPNDFMLDVLRLMRESELPMSMIDIRDDSLIGGKHKERAIKYALQRLEAQKLIERCDPPAGIKFGRKPPAYYRALGSDVPGWKKTPHAQGVSNKSLSIGQIDCAGTDPIDKTDCRQTPFVDSSDSEPAGAKAVDKTELSTNPIVDRNDCPGTDLAVDTDLDGHRVESIQEAMNKAWRWTELDL